MTAVPLREERLRRPAFFCLLATAVALLLLASPPTRAAEHVAPTTAQPASVTTAPSATGQVHVTPAPEGGHEEKPNLMPPPGTVQIITSLTTLLIFVLLLVILSKYAWGPIVQGLKHREDKIRKDIKDAEETRLRAERTLKDYQSQLATAQKQVQDLISKATADAQALATSIRMNAQQEAEEAKERAAKEIEGAKNQAIAEIYDQAANLATNVAEKILRRNLNADDQRELVRSSIEQLKGVNAN